LADDNLSLQQDLENLQAAFSKASYYMLGGIRQIAPHLESSLQLESNANDSMVSEVDHWRSRYNSLHSLLSTFVPFEQSAGVVEHAASIIYQRLLSSSNDDHDQNIISEALDEVSDPSKCRPTMQFKKYNDCDATATFHSAAGDFKSNQKTTATPVTAPDFVAKTSQAATSAKTEIQSYQQVLASYEHELNAAWSREADLYKELRSLRAAFGKQSAHRNHVSSLLSTPSVPSSSLSTPSKHASLKKMIFQANAVLLETKIPPSDSFLEEVFSLHAHQLFHLLSRQVAAHHDDHLELIRLSQHNFFQDCDPISC
jgi:hypothetical protein